jgi:hypothetical protein
LQSLQREVRPAHRGALQALAAVPMQRGGHGRADLQSAEESWKARYQTQAGDWERRHVSGALCGGGIAPPLTPGPAHCLGAGVKLC